VKQKEFGVKGQAAEDQSPRLLPVIPWCERHGVAIVAYSPFGYNDFPSPRSREGQVLHGIADVRRVPARQRF
jgi:diketogulonate reductase-like aldo/keto reductase